MVSAVIDRKIGESDAAYIYRRWCEDPIVWARDAMGQTLLEFQSKMLQAIRNYRRVLVVTAPGTGKTFTLALAVIGFTSLNPYSHAMTTGPTWAHLEQKLWPQIDTLVRKAKVSVGHKQINKTELIFDRDWLAYAASPDRPETIGGTHKAKQLAALDDAHAVPDYVWNIIDDNWMAGHGSHVVAIGNPLSASGPFYRASLPGSGWHVINFSALNHPNVIQRRQIIPGAVTHEKVDRIRTLFGEGSPEWKREVLGEFADDVTKALISRMALIRAEESEPTVKDGAHLGIDISGEGDDLNVASLVVDRVLVDQWQWSGVDTMVTTGRIINLVAEIRGRGIVLPWENVHIDDTGIGAVGPRLHEQGCNVDRVNFGSGPSGAWDLPSLNGAKLENRRAEMYATAAQLINDGQLKIPSRFEATWVDLCQPEWDGKVRSDGSKCLIKKDIIKKRIGRSPDHGDSLVLALSRSGGGSLFGFA